VKSVSGKSCINCLKMHENVKLCSDNTSGSIDRTYLKRYKYSSGRFSVAAFYEYIKKKGKEYGLV
jgi:hypothetical protein